MKLKVQNMNPIKDEKLLFITPSLIFNFENKSISFIWIVWGIVVGLV